MFYAIVLVVILAYAGICLALFLMQRSLLYFPQPRAAGGAPFGQTFDRGHVQLQLTVRARPGPGAVLYFGGNGEEVSGSLGPLAAAFPEREIVMLHYRGYGGSTGRPTEAAIAEDAEGLFDRVHAAHPDIILVGRSLGSGVATRLASVRPAVALVLVTPYDSLLGIAQRQFRGIPVRWLLLDKYESWRHVPRVRAPTLLIAAEHDEVIPAASTERLRGRFPPGQVRAVVIPGTSHNTIGETADYVRALASIDGGVNS